MNRTLPAIAVLALGALLAVSGCGGDSSSSSAGGGAYGGEEAGGGKTASAGDEKNGRYGETASTGGSDTGTVTVAMSPELGEKVIVDEEGFTLYDFHKDTGTKSACYGACAKAWPPLTTSGAPQATSGAEAAKLGTTKRSDGTVQVTYAGHPLYTFVEDAKPGEAKGNDVSAFGGQWYALSPSGEEAGG